MNKIIISQKNFINKSLKATCFKWMYELSGNNYRVALRTDSFNRKGAIKKRKKGPISNFKRCFSIYR